MSKRIWAMIAVGCLLLVGVGVGVAFAFNADDTTAPEVLPAPSPTSSPSSTPFPVPVPTESVEPSVSDDPHYDGIGDLPPQASDADVAVAEAFLEQWLTYDSDRRDEYIEQISQIAPNADLPDVPNLGWDAQWQRQHTQSWRAEVSVTDSMYVMGRSVFDGVSEITIRTSYLALFTYTETDCPWGEIEQTTGDDFCAISHYDGRQPWTVLVVDGEVIGIEEPQIITDP